MPPRKLSLNKQWSKNATARRKRIIDAGGAKFDVLLGPDHNLRLDAVLRDARKSEPGLSKTEWLTRMIDSEFGKLGAKAPVKRRAGRDRSNAPSAP